MCDIKLWYLYKKLKKKDKIYIEKFKAISGIWKKRAGRMVKRTRKGKMKR